MVYFYFGENDFKIREHINTVKTKFIEKYGNESVSKINASTTDPQQFLAEIVNINLFSIKRLIILSNATENKEIWTNLGNILQRIPDEVDLIITATSPDKRTKTFKKLMKIAKPREFSLPKNRDLLEFVLTQAADNQVEIKRDAANELIIYTGGNPWRISSEISKFKVFNRVVTIETIHDLVEPELEASAFGLLDNLLSGHREKALSELKKLRKIEDANKFLGLLAYQVFALSAVMHAGNRSISVVAKETGTHPFVIEKMFNAMGRVKTSDVKEISKIIADTDAKIKSSGTDPWTLIEIAISKF